MFSALRFFIKFSIAFSLSFLILSIPIGKSTVFYKISRHVKPYDKKFVRKVKSLYYRTYRLATEFKKQFISNTSPKAIKKNNIDHVKGNALSNDRVKPKKKSPSKNDRPEQYLYSDKEKLNSIFN
jgi:hypothetical protein